MTTQITTFNTPTLALENLSFSYGPTPALTNASLHASPGDLLAIVGPNGCGKSTLLRLIVGQLRPHQGRILLDNTPTSTLSPPQLARQVALVPQQLGGASSAFGYTVREIVLMARHAAHAQSGAWNAIGFETESDLQLANESMWAADVHHLADRPLDTLSGGERQRVAIARALTQQTPIILLDEPTSALDLHHQLDLLETLHTATKEQNRTAILVTHDLNLALTHATRTALLDRGQVIAEGPTGDILTPQLLEPIYRVKVIRESDTLRFLRSPAS